jgi:hypothetical protein
MATLSAYALTAKSRMKTTIEIPEPLYKKAKIRAVETGQTLRQLVLASLERELDDSGPGEKPATSYWARRKLLPEYARLRESGAYQASPGVPSIDEILEEVKADPAR